MGDILITPQIKALQAPEELITLHTGIYTTLLFICSFEWLLASFIDYTMLSVFGLDYIQELEWRNVMRIWSGSERLKVGLHSL